MKGFFLLLLSCLTLPTAQAHDARPLSIIMMEQTAGLYRVIVRAPPTLDAKDAPSVIWPDNCKIKEHSSLSLAFGNTSLIACSGGLPGHTISLNYPNFNPSITTLLRIEGVNGNSQTAILPPSESAWEVPLNPDWKQVAVNYSLVGIQHIWAGIDHLLFVAGLLLLARKPRKIIFAITGFTLAHSITLSLATLGYVRVPIPLIEALIALSILFLATEISRKETDSFSHRYPVLLSFAFGLLHGFGFASVLNEVGLPVNELFTGLLFFNIGVELGQLVFIAALISAILCWKTLSKNTSFEVQNETPWIKAGAYVLGIPAAYWVIERSLLAFSI